MNNILQVYGISFFHDFCYIPTNLPRTSYWVSWLQRRNLSLKRRRTTWSWREPATTSSWSRLRTRSLLYSPALRGIYWRMRQLYRYSHHLRYFIFSKHLYNLFLPKYEKIKNFNIAWHYQKAEEKILHPTVLQNFLPDMCSEIVYNLISIIMVCSNIFLRIALSKETTNPLCLRIFKHVDILYSTNDKKFTRKGWDFIDYQKLFSFISISRQTIYLFESGAIRRNCCETGDSNQYGGGDW